MMRLMPPNAFFNASMGEGCCGVMSSPVTLSHFARKATVRRAQSWAVGEDLAGTRSFERGACAAASIKGGDRPTADIRQSQLSSACSRGERRAVDAGTAVTRYGGFNTG